MIATDRMPIENVDVTEIELDPDALRRVPRALAFRHDILSLATEGNQLTVAIPDAEDRDAIDRLRDDQTIVLGGLIKDTDSLTLSKLPGLADIPIIGKIFQNRQRMREHDEVVFLITPHVIYPNSAVPDH